MHTPSPVGDLREPSETLREFEIKFFVPFVQIQNVLVSENFERITTCETVCVGIRTMYST